MSNVWIEKATELQSALQVRALADYLKNNSQPDIARFAGERFAAIPEREQASIISTLAADLEAQLQQEQEQTAV